MLTESEISTYAPNVKLTGAALVGAIALAQAQLEGVRGANRKLGKAIYTKIYRINTGSQTFRIQEFPLVGITSLKGRIGNIKTRFGRQTGLSDWLEIEPDDYIADSDGLVTINRTFLHGVVNGYGFSRAGRTSFFTEVEANYEAGIDFSDSSSSEAIALKASLGQVLDYQVNSSLNQGITMKDIDGDYRVSYSSGGNAGRGRVGAAIGQVPDGMLEVARKYRIIGGIGMRG